VSSTSQDRAFWRPSAWEAFLVVLVLAAGTWSSILSPYYLNIDQILESSRHFLIPGLLTLGLMIVVVTGEIDISLASTLAVGAVLFAKCSAHDVPIWLATPIVTVICGALGAFNGALVAWLGLPSLAVTLGTMGAYRGLAFIIGSEVGYTDFSDAYLYVGSEEAFGIIPIALIVFAILAIAVGVLMHRTIFGRRCFAIGNNREAAWIAGVNVRRTKIVAYAIAGALAGLAALLWIGQYGSARGDNADGLILLVVTAVVLAGVDINGGKGTTLGVVLALLLLGTLRNGLGLANVPGPTQTVVFGALLVLGVLRPVAMTAIRHARSLRWTRSDRERKPEPAKPVGT